MAARRKVTKRAAPRKPEPEPDREPEPDHESDPESEVAEPPAKKVNTENQEEVKDEDWSATVTVLAGVNKLSFTLHRKILRENSDFFRKALSGTWKENQEGSVTLPEVDPMSFKVYASWIYSHKVDLQILEYGSDPSKLLSGDEISGLELCARRDLSKPAKMISDKTYQHATSMVYVDRLVRLWCHGDFLGDHGFQNAVIDALVDGIYRRKPEPELPPYGTISTSTLHFLTDSTTSACPLRKLFVDFSSEPERQKQLASEQCNAPVWLLKGLSGSSLPKKQRSTKKDSYHLTNVDGET